MAEIRTQVHIEMEDKVGRLAEATDKLKEAGVNVRALVAWVQDGTGHLVFLPDDPGKLEQVECPEAKKMEQSEVVCVELPDEVGALNAISRKLADAGIQINMCCATAAAGKALTVLQTSDNAKAAELI